MSKLISTFQIRFDDETKAVISELKNKLDEVNKSLNARDGGFLLGDKRKGNSWIGQIIAAAVSNQIKEMPRPDGLLKAMQAEAANDASEPELLQMGQWVFEGCDPKIQSASVDSDGEAVRWGCEKNELDLFEGQFVSPARVCAEVVKGKFDSTNWRNSAINRQPVNDVDYLSESVPEIQGLEASDIIIDEMGRDYSHNSNCLHAVVPQITQADMQLIFIKNLSDCLIQRMHSMDRFSEDDYAIGGDKLIAWDILIYEPLDAYAVLMRGPDRINVADLLLIRDDGPMADAGWNTTSEAFAILRTITEAELPAFRAALEACYA